jgi:hypothetical protein
VAEGQPRRRRPRLERAEQRERPVRRHVQLDRGVLQAVEPGLEDGATPGRQPFERSDGALAEPAVASRQATAPARTEARLEGEAPLRPGRPRGHALLDAGDRVGSTWSFTESWGGVPKSSSPRTVASRNAASSFHQATVPASASHVKAGGSNRLRQSAASASIARRAASPGGAPPSSAPMFATRCGPLTFRRAAWPGSSSGRRERGR